MDNFKIDISAESFDSIIDALKIAFRHNGSHARCWTTGKLDDVSTLILFWSTPEPCWVEVNEFPAPLAARDAAEVVRQWLDIQDYEGEPIFDGSSYRGFRIFADDWGHVGGSMYAICGVQPYWSMHGK